MTQDFTTLSVADTDRFWATIDRRGADECWEWHARKHEGYGIFDALGRGLRAHRVSFILCVGPIPDGLCVCHTCDNRPCCNPKHLFPGTRAENNQDRVRKGRSVHGKGEEVHRAKLTAADVQDIRSRLAAGANGEHLGREYGVTRMAIYKIRHRLTWKHLPASSTPEVTA